MLDPYKTICVVKHDGKEVGRVPLKAPRSQDYIAELVRHYGKVNVEYEYDEDGLLAMIWPR